MQKALYAFNLGVTDGDDENIDEQKPHKQRINQIRVGGEQHRSGLDAVNFKHTEQYRGDCSAGDAQRQHGDECGDSRCVVSSFGSGHAANIAGADFLFVMGRSGLNFFFHRIADVVGQNRADARQDTDEGCRRCWIVK